jgi:hypothetical protein
MRSVSKGKLGQKMLHTKIIGSVESQRIEIPDEHLDGVVIRHGSPQRDAFCRHHELEQKRRQLERKRAKA